MSLSRSTYDGIAQIARERTESIKAAAQEIADADVVGMHRIVMYMGKSFCVPVAWFILAKACGESDDRVMYEMWQASKAPEEEGGA